LRIVQLMGGQIRMETTLGLGSTFQFSVAYAPVTDGASTSEVEDLSDVRVLIIDDNATHCRFLEDMTRRWRMQPQTSASGAEGLVRLDEAASFGRPFSLVLVDQQMPAIDGFEVLRRSRGNSSSPVPAIMMFSSDHSTNPALC